MSNFECASRTNYFRVADEERFNQRIAGKLTSNDGSVSVWSRTEDEVKRYAFGAYGEILYEGIPLTDSEEFLTEMQAILPDGEAVVIEEMGHEKLRYLSGVAYIITKHDNACIDLDAFIRRKVREMVQDSLPAVFFFSGIFRIIPYCLRTTKGGYYYAKRERRKTVAVYKRSQ